MANYEGYCVKCREKREFDGQEVELANGRRGRPGSVPHVWNENEPYLGQEDGLPGHGGRAHTTRWQHSLGTGDRAGRELVRGAGGLATVNPLAVSVEGVDT